MSRPRPGHASSANPSPATPRNRRTPAPTPPRPSARPSGRKPARPARPAAPALYPYQEAGIDFAQAANYRCLIADEPGLGKTAQALGCIARDPDLLPAVVVAPPSTIIQTWCKEVKKWLGDTPVAYIEGKSDHMPAPGWRGVLILSWAILQDMAPLIGRWKPRLMIADEVHFAKEESSQRGAALEGLARRIPHLIFLTGTPMINRPAELHRLLDLVAPGRFGEVSDFEEMAEIDPDNLRERMSRVMIRRLFAAEQPDIPPKTRHFHEITLTGRAAQEYRLAEQEWQKWLDVRLPELVAREYTKRGILPKNASRDLAAIIERRAALAIENEALVKAGRLRQIVGAGKAIHAAKIAADLWTKGRAVVLFAEHGVVVEAIRAALIQHRVRYALIDGSTKQEDRSEIIERFQDAARPPRVLICTRAAYAGVTLHRAAHMVFAERWWTCVEDDQAEGRIYRIGQKRATHVIYVHAKGTIDERMDELVKTKRELIRNLIGVTDAKGPTPAAPPPPAGLQEAQAEDMRGVESQP